MKLVFITFVIRFIQLKEDLFLNDKILFPPFDKRYLYCIEYRFFYKIIKSDYAFNFANSTFLVFISF